MNKINYSFIIPVYNRPEEVAKLLDSLSQLDFERNFEVVVIEDGSDMDCEAVCSRFRESVIITYLSKPNSGPGDSRNYGMKRASGDYFIILDSDCIVPNQYLKTVDDYLQQNFVDCYGGPDAAYENFSSLQKAINYTMTSFFTTGGIRGGSERLGKFQPRSFNMGLSKKAFEATGGFGKIHPGEDPDLILRLWKNGFKTALIKNAFVYHERRISWSLFYKQVNKFGKVRIILNKWHPSSGKLSYWFPIIFCLVLLMAIVSCLLGSYLLLIAYLLYFSLLFIDATFKNGIVVGIMTIPAVFIQFYGYGSGFLLSWWKINLLKLHEKAAFPNLFFK